ncbi:MAG: TolC family outer membrane protein [Alphaproteobacteria bacterium]|nr:TolC family outer membrane protein [Alphaproteobacteria bacterium]
MTRRFFWTGSSAILLLLALIHTSHAEVQGRILTLQETLRHAYTTNPGLQAAREQLQATHELLPQAYAGWKPSVDASASAESVHVDQGGDSDTDGTPKELAVSLTQPVYKGGSTMARIAGARYLIQSQTALLKASEQDVLLAAATAFMDVVRDQALLDLSVNNRDVIKKQLDATQARFDAGELTKTDVSQASARLAEAEAGITNARGASNSTKAVFERVTGLAPERLEVQTVSLTIPQAMEEAALQAEESSPLVISAENLRNASEKDIDDIRGLLFPDVDITGSYGRLYDPVSGSSDEQTTGRIGIVASIPLYEAGAVRSRVREAKHTANQRYLEVLDVKRQARQETVSNWENLQAARAGIVSRKAQVEAARVATEGVRAEAEYGTRTVLDALDAEQELLDAQVALVSAQRDEAVAQFALMAGLGLLLPDSLGFAQDAIDVHGNLDDVKHRIFDMHVDRVGDPQ